MRIFSTAALVTAFTLVTSLKIFANPLTQVTPSLDKDSYTMTVAWMHTSPGASTGIRGGDVKLYRTSTQQSEVLGAATVAIHGVLHSDCVNFASDSASGNAQITIFTTPNAARFEIRDVPTYVINARDVLSCGIAKVR